MKQAVLVLLLSAAASFAAWPGVPFSEVRAYAWPQAKPMERVILADMKLAEGVINKDGALLNQQQTSRLLSAQERRYKDRPAAGCHIPHNAFVFYDSQHRPVAFLEICFNCLTSRSNPPDRQSDPDFIALATIFAELHLPFGRHTSVKELRADIDWLLDPAHAFKPGPAQSGAAPPIPGLPPVNPK